MYPIEKICTRLGLHIDDVKKEALTLHIENDVKNNSRNIFIGQFVFRGRIAAWIASNSNGTGRQWQQYLGNILSHTHLHELFNSWGLLHFVNRNFYKKENSHLYVLGFLGYATSTCGEQDLNWFMNQYFIYPNDAHLPQTFIPKDDWQKLIFLCKQHNYAAPDLTHIKIDSVYHFTCKVDTNKFNHASVSYEYARKKVIRMALKNVVTHQSQLLDKDASHIEIVDKLKHEKKNQVVRKRIEAIEREKQRLQEKKISKVERIEQKELDKLKKDKARRDAKKNAKEKEKKTKSNIYREYTADEIKTMNPAKRRRLEDLGII